MKRALDWSEMEMEYIAGAMSYRDLAERYGISVTAVSKHAVKGRWQEKRSQHRAEAMAQAKESAVAVQTLSFRTLCETHALLTHAALTIAQDTEQFKRYILKGKDAQFEKADAQALRSVVAALSDLTDIYMRLYGTASEPQGDTTGVIILPDADGEPTPSGSPVCEPGGPKGWSPEDTKQSEVRRRRPRSGWRREDTPKGRPQRRNTGPPKASTVRRGMAELKRGRIIFLQSYSGWKKLRIGQDWRV